MDDGGRRVHPYIPNSVPDVKAEMLAAIGAAERRGALRRRSPSAPPAAGRSTCRRRSGPRRSWSATWRGCSAGTRSTARRPELPRRRLLPAPRAGRLRRDQRPRRVPDRLRRRALRGPRPLPGAVRVRAMMGELLDMDVVNVPTYDGFQAAAHRAAHGRPHHRPAAASWCRRRSAATSSPRSRDYVRPGPRRGAGARSSRRPACSTWTRCGARARAPTSPPSTSRTPPTWASSRPRGRGDRRARPRRRRPRGRRRRPLALGVLAPPAAYGADIACGDIQPLGIHMQFGGGHGGFIASRDDPRIVMEYPSRLFGIAPTAVRGRVRLRRRGLRAHLLRRARGGQGVGRARPRRCGASPPASTWP